MNILALDTSGPVAGCALMMDGRIVHSIAALHGRTHSESIMPMVDQALSESGITVLQLDCIAAEAAGFEVATAKKYGKTGVTILRKERHGE